MLDEFHARLTVFLSCQSLLPCPSDCVSVMSVTSPLKAMKHVASQLPSQHSTRQHPQRVQEEASSSSHQAAQLQ